MSTTTVNINVKDRSVPITAAVNIAAINQPNPVTNYPANADQIWQLIHIPKYDVRDSATNAMITGNNYYDYFPDRDPSGGGGGGGTQPVLVEKTITENGVYDALSDNADGYSKVTASVANTYTQEDNGKVVNDGALVDQGSDTVHDNGIVDTTLISSLTVDVSGGGTSVPKDVRFYDYDGTIAYSYTAEEFAALESLPDNPTHEGLTPQGWNWTLTDAKTYVSSYGRLDIGQMYVTSDGKTRLYITLSEGRTSPILKLYLASGSEVDVDWGDGTNHETLSGSGDKTTNRHEYTSAGSYVISITVLSGSVTIPQYMLSNGNSSTSSPDRAYLNAITKVEIGSNVTSINGYAFQYCTSLLSINIPSSVTSIGSSAFEHCSSLLSITIPNSVTSISSYAFNYCSSISSIIMPNSVMGISRSAFQYCSSLLSITIPSSVMGIDRTVFGNCTSLSSVIIPSSVTGIGGGAFQYCSSLSSITIPSSVTSISSSVFQSCTSLSSITIPNSVTSIDSSAFQSCESLTSITIPSSVTSIGSSAFQSCTSLSSITIPSGVTSIGSYSFYSCYSLAAVTIPSSVTSIGSYSFNTCSSLATITILGKSSGDISGAPWGANTGAPTNTQIIWKNDQ